MTQVFQIALLGLGAGSLYAIAAIGLVLVYRGSGVVNFAQGAMGMVAAYIFFEVHQRAHLPEMIAVIAGLLASGVIGAAFHFLVLRRMTNASMLAKIVATLALLIVLQDAVTLLFGQVPQIVTSLLPTGEVRILGRRSVRIAYASSESSSCSPSFCGPSTSSPPSGWRPARSPRTHERRRRLASRPTSSDC